MNLSELHNGQSVYVSHIGGNKVLKRHLEELGFVGGQRVTRVYASPAGTPIVFSMLGQKIALRRNEAELVYVERDLRDALGRIPEEDKLDLPHDAGRETVIKARHCGGHCAGCSCCGQKEKKKEPASSEKGIVIALVGNPNCGKTALFNALSGGHERTGNYAGVTVGSTVGETSFEGRDLRIIDLPGTYSLRAFSPEEAYVANELSRGGIDVVVNVLDVTNIERNLLLTLQLRAMGLPMVGVLNMYDEFEGSGSTLDVEALSARLGMPFIPTVANRKQGVEEVLREAIRLAEAHKAAVRVGEREVENSRTAMERTLNATKTPSYIRSREIRKVLRGIFTRKESRVSVLSTLADRTLAASVVGYLLFFLIMGLIFFCTFELGAYPQEWMENGVDAFANVVEGWLPDGWLRDLISGGIIGGVGSVIVFLPNILILYFFISVLEDSGYLSRAALLADPLLRRVGLHGKSFFPMLMGFGCNVPAVMATRTIESRKSRLITMMTLPFMSCSARLPVYTVLSGAFFPEQAALVMLCLYAGGIMVAFLSAAAMSKLMHRGEESHFLMEMPPYRRPVMSSVLRHTWEKGREYLHKMGGVILVAAVVIWALGYFPVPRTEMSESERQEQSYLGRIGHTIEPVLSPLGYDWRMGVGIVSGVGAKELMVASLGVLYNTPEEATEDETEKGLSVSMRNSGIGSAAALSYLVFALLYFPCIATITAIRNESGRWKYALFTSAYTTIVAYVMAFIVYRLALMWM